MSVTRKSFLAAIAATRGLLYPTIGSIATLACHAEVPLRWKSRIAMPRSVIEEQRSEEQRDEARKANGPLG
jgi:hypothetical protein